jgi:SWI/SNF-related matrix-associated actin-dependent regulator of chromatin subfamily A member 5
LQGKTIQTIALICYLKENEGVTGPSLVVCPLTVLMSWCSELEKWAPGLHFLQFHSSDLAAREELRHKFESQIHDFDVVVTSYEMLTAKNMGHLFRRHHFNYVVLDEGHRIKRHDTQVAEACRKLHSENRLILTGTPLQNNLYELWSLLEFLYPSLFDRGTFEEAFDLQSKIKKIDEELVVGAHKLLDLFMLRRLKSQVELKLPPMLETRVYCPLSSVQAYWYKAILLKDLDALAAPATGSDTIAGGQGARYKRLMNLVMQLRKCCQHPFLFEGAESGTNTSIEELTGTSGKLAVLDMLLRSLYKNGHRVVIFSQFTTVLDILEDYCGMRGWTYFRLDGQTPRVWRTVRVKEFNAEGSPHFLCLMSTKSGAFGINLQTAGKCNVHDLVDFWMFLSFN